MKVRPKLDPVDPLRRYDVPMSCDLLGISRAKYYKDVKDGKIKIIKDGGRTFTPGTEIVRLSSVS